MSSNAEITFICAQAFCLAAMVIFAHFQAKYIAKLEARIRTLTLRVWESKDSLQLGKTFVPVYMTDDAEKLDGVITVDKR